MRLLMLLPVLFFFQSLFAGCPDQDADQGFCSHNTGDYIAAGSTEKIIWNRASSIDKIKIEIDVPGHNTEVYHFTDNAFGANLATHFYWDVPCVSIGLSPVVFTMTYYKYEYRPGFGVRHFEESIHTLQLLVSQDYYPPNLMELFCQPGVYTISFPQEDRVLGLKAIWEHWTGSEWEVLHDEDSYDLIGDFRTGKVNGATNYFGPGKHLFQISYDVSSGGAINCPNVNSFKGLVSVVVVPDIPLVEENYEITDDINRDNSTLICTVPGTFHVLDNQIPGSLESYLNSYFHANGPYAITAKYSSSYNINWLPVSDRRYNYQSGEFRVCSSDMMNKNKCMVNLMQNGFIGIDVSLPDLPWAPGAIRSGSLNCNFDFREAFIERAGCVQQQERVKNERRHLYLGQERAGYRAGIYGSYEIKGVLKVYNIFGQLVFNSDNYTVNSSISTDEWKPGTYIFTFFADGEKPLSFKLTKSH